MTFNNGMRRNSIKANTDVVDTAGLDTSGIAIGTGTIIVAQFAKTPVAGRVKTRLLPALGAQRAMLLHQRMVAHTARTISALRGVVHHLWSSEGGRFLAELAQSLGCAHSHQQGADLGERMSYAAQRSCEQSDGVLLIGSDCPFIDAEYIDAALSALSQYDVVFGPANDGGYVLLGLRHWTPALFSGVSWGSAEVLQQSLALARQHNLSTYLLPPLADIDRPEDLCHLQSHPIFRQFLEV